MSENLRNALNVIDAIMTSNHSQRRQCRLVIEPTEHGGIAACLEQPPEVGSGRIRVTALSIERALITLASFNGPNAVLPEQQA